MANTLTSENSTTHQVITPWQMCANKLSSCLWKSKIRKCETKFLL